MLSHMYINTPLGKMVAAGDDSYIHSLKFCNHNNIETSMTPALKILQHELDLYFNHKLTNFTSKLTPQGTDFQNKVWHALQQVPYGSTTSYKNIADNINQPKSFRAVSNANAANQILILIPCHRIIANSGNLCGFTAGIEKKKWLLKHEKQYKN